MIVLPFVLRLLTRLPDLVFDGLKGAAARKWIEPIRLMVP